MSSIKIIDKLKKKLRGSLSTKFILSIIMTLVLISISIMVVQRSLLNNNISEIQELKVERVGKLVSAASQNAILSYDFELLERFAKEIRKDIDVVDVTFLDQNSKRLNSEMNKDSLTASESKFGKDVVASSEFFEQKFPITSDGTQIGTLVIKTHPLETQRRINSLLPSVSIVFVLGIGLLIVIMWLMTNKIVINPLKSIESVASELSTGNVEIEMKSDRSDEIGSLQSAFSEMISSIKKQSGVVEQISLGNLDINVPVRSEKDLLSKSLIKVTESLKTLVSEVKYLSESAVNGNLSVRGDSNKFEGGYKDIIFGVNNTLDAVILPIEEGAKVLSKMAKNDFTAKVTGNYKGDHKIIVDSINEVSNSLSNAFFEINAAVHETYNATSQISSSSEEMAAGAQEQSSQTTEVAGAIEEMTKTILETTKNSSIAAEAAKNSGLIAKEGGKVVSQTIEGMNRVAEVVKKSAETVQELGKSSDQIGEIVQVIDDIADQTNLLALNAAIEAARAGEQGRGFAVVADEVRKLAERTTKATKEIATMIKQIQKDTEGAVISMKLGTEEVVKGKSLADKAGQSLQQIIASADEVVDMVTQVAAASEEQSSAAEQISKNVEGISNVTQESAAGVQHIARAAEDLNRLTVNLQEMISRFKIDDSSLERSKGNSSTHLAVRSNGVLVHN